MEKNLTHAVEDYLKIIYDLTVSEERATTNQIAAALGIAPASVTGMIKKLAVAEPPLVEYQKHRGVQLTERGRKSALEIIRHHRLIELYLHEMLGYSWDEVDAEADRLEHVISEEFEERIAQALGDPTHDPHGDPIPTRELEMPTEVHTRLSDLRAGDHATIQRVRDSDSDLLRYLESIGILPGIDVQITGYSPFDENLTLRLSGNDTPIVLGAKITRHIYVDKAEAEG